MTRVHRFLAMMLLLCLSFQVAASTLAELCRFECEQAIQSELIKTRSVSQDIVVSKPEQGIGAVRWTAQRDDLAPSGMTCEGCTSCQECMPSIALIPSYLAQPSSFKNHLEMFVLKRVSLGEPERPFKPPRICSLHA